MIKKIKSQMSELDHNGQQKSLMQRFMSDIRELFDLVCKELRLTIFFPIFLKRNSSSYGFLLMYCTELIKVLMTLKELSNLLSS